MIGAVLAEIKRLQTDWAVSALRQPSGRDAFDYGHAAGVMRGLAMAEEAVEKVLRGDEEKKKHW